MNQKEKYLIDIKNAMFWHFNSTEIKDTLTELNTHFKSALHNGISAEEVISEYGRPEAVVDELRSRAVQVVEKKNIVEAIKERLFFAYVLGMCVAFALSLSDIFYLKDIAVNILIIAGPALIWFLSGNNYMIDVLSMTIQKRRDFIKHQAAVLLLALVLNLCSFFVAPHMLITGHINGPMILYCVYFIIAVLCFMTILSLRKMFQGNLYMFFVVIQNISIIVGMFMYIRFLYNVESLESTQFAITQYFLCLFALIPYGVYVYRKERNNNIECVK